MSDFVVLTMFKYFYLTEILLNSYILAVLKCVCVWVYQFINFAFPSLPQAE